MARVVEMSEDGAETSNLQELFDEEWLCRDGDALALTLEYPVEDVRELTIRRPTGADLRAVVDLEAGSLIRLPARLTGVDEAVIGGIDGADLARLSTVLAAFAPESADGFVSSEGAETTLRLEHPVTLRYRGPNGEREELLETLTFRRPKARDNQALHGLKPGAAGLRMIERLTGQPAKVLDQLDGADVTRAGLVAASFFQSARPKKTGKT